MTIATPLLSLNLQYSLLSSWILTANLFHWANGSNPKSKTSFLTTKSNFFLLFPFYLPFLWFKWMTLPAILGHSLHLCDGAHLLCLLRYLQLSLYILHHQFLTIEPFPSAHNLNVLSQIFKKSSLEPKLFDAPLYTKNLQPLYLSFPLEPMPVKLLLPPLHWNHSCHRHHVMDPCGQVPGVNLQSSFFSWYLNSIWCGWSSLLETLSPCVF